MPFLDADAFSALGGEDLGVAGVGVLSGLPWQAGTVRLGWLPSAATVLVSRALAALRHTEPPTTS
ncbi:hypothetical protein ACFC18_29110 [Streptomyces sp. NPDC056121]|uniref:hypothetical protein n=1 Tax=unclassified Streptomyces TaxID=2593676 RepID=UPI0035D652AF